MRLLSKLKYVGMPKEDLIEIYCSLIRSVVEYCSVVFHSGLTNAQSKQLENVQSTAMRILLQENFVSPSAAREMTGLRTLSERRQSRIESFSLRCLKHPKHSSMFPLNNKNTDKELRTTEKFKVNFARTSQYQKSGLIHCQKILNQLASEGRA